MKHKLCFLQKLTIAAAIVIAFGFFTFGFIAGRETLPPMQVVNHLCPAPAPAIKATTIQLIAPANGTVFAIPAKALAPWLSPAKRKALSKPLPIRKRSHV